MGVSPQHGDVCLLGKEVPRGRSTEGLHPRGWRRGINVLGELIIHGERALCTKDVGREERKPLCVSTPSRRPPRSQASLEW